MRWSEGNVPTTTTRLNPERVVQNYSSASSAPHHYVSRQQQQQQPPAAAGARSRDAATQRSRRHCAGGRRAERTDERRDVERTGNDAGRQRPVEPSVRRASLMCFGWTRHPGRGRTALHSTVKVTAQYNDDGDCCKYSNCYCCWSWHVYTASLSSSSAAAVAINNF